MSSQHDFVPALECSQRTEVRRDEGDSRRYDCNIDGSEKVWQCEPNHQLPLANISLACFFLVPCSILGADGDIDILGERNFLLRMPRRHVRYQMRIICCGNCLAGLLLADFITYEFKEIDSHG